MHDEKTGAANLPSVPRTAPDLHRRPTGCGEVRSASEPACTESQTGFSERQRKYAVPCTSVSRAVGGLQRPREPRCARCATIFHMEPDIRTGLSTLEDGIDGVLERVVYGAVGITTAVLERATPDSELTFAQWRVLVVLGRHEAGLRVGEIATRIGATGSATSRLLGRMERRGLVVSGPDEQDRRAAIVRLSDAGERLRARIVQDRRDLIRQLLDAHGRPLPPNLQAGLEAIAEAFARYA